MKNTIIKSVNEIYVFDSDSYPTPNLNCPTRKNLGNSTEEFPNFRAFTFVITITPENIGQWLTQHVKSAQNKTVFEIESKRLGCNYVLSDFVHYASVSRSLRQDNICLQKAIPVCCESDCHNEYIHPADSQYSGFAFFQILAQK